MNVHVQDFDFKEAEVRVAALAKERGVEAPALIAEDSAPSQALVDFCDTYGLTLDFVVTGEGPVYRSQAAETPILHLYRQIMEIHEAATNYLTGANGKTEDEEIDRLFWSRIAKLQEQMMAMPSTCAADFAAKAIVDLGEGGVLSESDSGPVWQEARALVNRSHTTSSLPAMFREWQELTDRLNAMEDGPESNVVFEQLTRTMDSIIAATPRSIHDMALKILVADDRGDMNMNAWQEALVRQAKELIGFPVDQDTSTSANDPLPGLFREWEQTRDGFNASPGDPDQDPEAGRLFNRHHELVEQMLRTPPVSPAGAAALVDLLIADEFVETSSYNGAPSVLLQNLRGFLAQMGDASQGAMSSATPKPEAPQALLDHIQGMQDVQCTLCGLLDIIARTFSNKLSGSQTESDFLALIDAVKRQAQVVNEGLDAVNLPGTGGAAAA